MNVILIGYRCTGKSTTGKALARIMEIPFVDTDRVIEKTMRSTISSIVAVHGWERFRKIESQVLKGVLTAESIVVATGGGIVLDSENVLTMGLTGTVVWLRASCDTIIQRMSQDAATPGQRPSLTDSPLEKEVMETLTLRTPIYREAAHMVVDTDRGTPAEIAATIKRRLDNGR